VFIADRGEEALGLMRCTVFDIIYLDIKMPDLCGEQIIKEIKRNGLKTKIVVVTGITDELIKDYILFLGADHYITKPFKILQIIESLKITDTPIPPNSAPPEGGQARYRWNA